MPWCFLKPAICSSKTEKGKTMDRWYATLTIYGDFDRLEDRQIVDLAAAAARDGFNFDHSDGYLTSHDFLVRLKGALAEGKPLELSHALAANGEFPETEEGLRGIGLSFIRYSSSEDHGATIATCIEGGETRERKASGRAASSDTRLSFSGDHHRLEAIIERLAASVTLTISGELDSVWVETVGDIGEAAEEAGAVFADDGTRVDRTSFVGKTIEAAVAQRPATIRVDATRAADIERLLTENRLAYFRTERGSVSFHRGSEPVTWLKGAEAGSHHFLTGPRATIDEYRAYHQTLVDLDRAIAAGPGM